MGLVLMLGIGTAFAQAPVVNPGWEVFVIREGSTEAPFIVANDDFVVDSIEVGTTEGGQKVGLATDIINGAMISQISTLHIDRLDNVATSGSLYGPYFNIWVTDGAGQYAVIANEPSNAEWGGQPWDVANWAELGPKTCKVYETPGWNTYTSWVHVLVGIAGPLTFADVADLVIAPPPPSYIQNAANGVGSGAPDVLGTEVAYGYTWVFGDTAANYVTGGDGFIVNGYSATATLSVQNTTQATSYATIEAALADADPMDEIFISDGTYNPAGTLSVNMALTISGESEAGVIINIPAAGGYGFSVAAADVTMEQFTLVANTTNQNYPIHASGTSNPPLGFDNLTIQNVTVEGVHRRAGFDIHGFNTVVLSHLTSRDATGGNGLQITGCIGVDMDNITTSDNAWGSIAIYSSNSGYLNRGSDDVYIDGSTCSLGEKNLFNQDEFGLFNTNIVVDGYDYIVRNMNYRPDAAGYYHYQENFVDASAFALGLEGVAVGSYILTIADGNATVIPGITVQAAIDGVVAGSTVTLTAGTFTPAAQVIINKDLIVCGDPGGLTDIAAGFNTVGGSYDPTSSMFYVDYGAVVIIKDLNFDGLGFAVQQAIQSRGADVTVQDCTFTNIMASTYDGRGIVFLAGNGLVQDCTMSDIQRIGVHIRGSAIGQPAPVVAVNNFGYTGKGIGDFLDYGIEFGGGGQGTVFNATITACVGIATVDGSDSAGILVTDYYGTGTIADITDSFLTGNSSGVVVGYAAVDMSSVSIIGTDLSGNPSGGVSSTGVEVTAVGNWWGHATGPFDNSDDTGTGGLFNPLGQGVPVSDNVTYNPWLGMAGGGIVPVTTGPLNCSQTITLTFSFEADEYTPDMFLYNAVVSATPGLNFGAVADLLPFGTTNNNFYQMSTGANQWTITGSTVGSPTYPVSGAGTTGLFSIEFSATGDVVGDVVFDSLTLRDPSNNTIPVNLEGAAITFDCTAPLAVTGISADPHHNRIEVNWAHDGLDVDHYEVFSGVWHDGSHLSVYPEYDDVVGNTVPTRPADYAAMLADALDEWDSVSSAAALTTDEVWMPAARGVYYYEVYAVDAAGNASPRASANDRATNYWLGDVSGDGEVTPVWDMDPLGNTFGLSHGDVDYNNLCDVGPTDNWSPIGVPLTDNDVDFEDLMMFSMNFGVVDENNKIDNPIATKALLAWTDLGSNQYALSLVGGAGIKGIHLTAGVTQGSISSVSAGQLLDAQSEMTFLKNIGSALDVSVAVTGAGTGFTGVGNLFIVNANEPILMSDLNIEVRGHDNSSIQMTLEEASGVLTPRVYALDANYPNPFNPLTKISFSLPEAQNVRLNVYGIDGKKVATLVNETRSAGLHEVLWMGRDDNGQAVASGLYFYRIDAGPYSQVRKMTLMK